jgi:hypothetical protein
MEGFWTLLKRAYIGIYHHMSRKHLQKYVDEIVFRYNTRSMTQGVRLTYGITKTEGRLTYKHLIGK